MAEAELTLAATDPTNPESSTVQQTDVEAGEAKLEGPEGRDRVLWLIGAALFALAGVLALLTTSNEVLGIVFLLVAMVFVVIAGGFIRRR